jgi:serine/threonine protein kinase
VPRNDFKYFEDMFSDLRRSPYIRVADDAIPDQSMFAYKYFKDHLLSFTQRDIPLPLMKRILRDSLRGIAALHEKGIVHTDIKANNIMVDWDESDGHTTIQQVQIADIEDAAYVPDNCAIVGRQVGNWMWRSPEAHASAQVHKPSDIFSFGIVVSLNAIAGPSIADLLEHSASTPSPNGSSSLSPTKNSRKARTS